MESCRDGHNSGHRVPQPFRQHTEGYCIFGIERSIISGNVPCVTRRVRFFLALLEYLLRITNS